MLNSSLRFARTGLREWRVWLKTTILSTVSFPLACFCSLILSVCLGLYVQTFRVGNTGLEYSRPILHLKKL